MDSLISSTLQRLPGIVLFICLLTIAVVPGYSQIEGLFVETYYVADSSDATDTTGGRTLQPGMRTYRVYLDLSPSSRLVQLFGSDLHPLRFSSTSDFYNNIDRPNSNFGYQLNKSWFDDNPTIALDSWLTIGLAANSQVGIPKAADTDGVFSEILNNNGGTAGVPGGLLKNTDPLAGIPLTTADGYLPNTGALGQWLDVGFKDLAGDDTTIFGPVYTGNEFLSYNAVLQQTDGIEGLDGNRVLVAQLTTSGALSFELNVVIDVWNGSSFNQITYVANGDSLLPGQEVSPFLVYPPSCGCTDPNYLEFSNTYSCHIEDSCQTPVVFGCLDTIACNYDPSANYHVQSLCCYPGSCNDRDLSFVCPGVSNGRFGIRNLHPNPVTSLLSVSVGATHGREAVVAIYDLPGRQVMFRNLGVLDQGGDFSIDVNGISNGLYQLVISAGNERDTRVIVIGE